MARTEYYNDPQAPKPNSIVPAVTVFVLDAQDRVLLIRRTDNGLWAIPGGAQDFGEYIKETAVRETKEESGIDVEVTGIVGIYSDPKHVMAYSDGEVRQQFSICFRARYLGGNPKPSNESSAVCWASRDDLTALPIHPSMQLRIDHGTSTAQSPISGDDIALNRSSICRTALTSVASARAQKRVTRWSGPYRDRISASRSKTSKSCPSGPVVISTELWQRPPLHVAIAVGAFGQVPLQTSGKLPERDPYTQDTTSAEHRGFA
ncbi:NUDIX hydrolase [Micromonospora sp. NPDC093277]|uniref:NUDIX hydrolase n=1 Tax=Micromonospora sp. NPDC093277 TaxID=3364291 RepID=UPI00382679E6